jgi:type II secretory pathway component GspD/PulD (secretin)
MALLAGCQATQLTERELAAGQEITGAKRAELAAINRGEVVFIDAPYYGEEVKVERSKGQGKPLPSRVEQAKSTSFNFQGSAKGAALEIENQTGIPVTIQTKYVTLDGKPYDMPVNSTLKLSNSGALSKTLAYIASRIDAEWSYDGATITFTRMIERSYSLPIPIGKTAAYSAQVDSLSLNGQKPVTISRTGSLDPWAGIEARLMAAIGSYADVILDEASSTLTVKAPPSVHRRVKAALADIDDIYDRRIGLEVAVYFVESDKVDDFAASLSARSGDVSFVGLANAISGNGVAAITRGPRSFNFRSIARNDAVFDFQQGSTTSQSGVWAPIVIQSNTNYVSSTTTTVDNGVSTTSLQTDQVDEGISIHALPRILGNNKIGLHLTVVQKSLNGIDTFSSNNSSVQLPRVDGRQFQSDVTLAPGETLLLAGYEQDVSRSQKSGPFSPKAWIAGGNSNAQTTNVRMILMVRPSILGG